MITIFINWKYMDKYPYHINNYYHSSIEYD